MRCISAHSPLVFRTSISLTAYRKALLVAVAAWAAAMGPERAPATTLTMDDLPNQPVDGLVHPSGVEFGFTVGGVPNTDAHYNAGGPGTITYVHDPSIEGTTSGVLEVILPTVSPSLRFGLAVATFDPTYVYVELFDATNTSLGVQSVGLSSFGSYSERLFLYNGVDVSRLLVDMTPASGVAPRFAFDNLTFVPEPTTALLVTVGLLGLGMRRRSM